MRGQGDHAPEEESAAPASGADAIGNEHDALAPARRLSTVIKTGFWWFMGMGALK